MCFRFDSCFGVHVHDDVDFYGLQPSATSRGMPMAPPPRHAATTKAPAPALRDGYYYSNGHQAHQPVHADDEASRRKRLAAPGVAAIGGHGYATDAWAADGDEASKHPVGARNYRGVVHGAGNGGAQPYYYEHEQPARKDVTKDYYYPTVNATSDLERY